MKSLRSSKTKESYTFFLAEICGRNLTRSIENRRVAFNEIESKNHRSLLKYRIRKNLME
jgi:hypothetical protein